MEEVLSQLKTLELLTATPIPTEIKMEEVANQLKTLELLIATPIPTEIKIQEAAEVPAINIA